MMKRFRNAGSFAARVISIVLVSYGTLMGVANAINGAPDFAENVGYALWFIGMLLSAVFHFGAKYFGNSISWSSWFILVSASVIQIGLALLLFR